jgi:NtrC-family two-component system response regulator AlgB
LFLDEVGDMSSDLQAQLLRVLESQSFERLGETVERKTNVRVIAATHHDLEAEVRAGRFRLDLYYRLAVFDVHLPPLRQRREDIVTLARHLLARAARAAGVPEVRMSTDVERLLEQSELPGNVRELRNEMERALALCGTGPVQLCHLSERLHRPRLPGPWVGGPFSLRELERAHIESVLARSESFEEAAAMLGIDDSTLWRKRRRLQLAVSKAS